MWKRWIPGVALAVYSAMLIRVVVFKAMPTIRIGHMRFRFSGQHTGPPNLVPFHTVGWFIYGYSGKLIATVNLVGNVALFVPIGLLAPLVYRRLAWQKAWVLAVAVGLAMESTEAVFHVGIFDVDDILLNAVGVMIGFWIFTVLAKRRRVRLR